MKIFACPRCGEITQILPIGGGRDIAEDMGVPFLGSLPIDPKIAESGDCGKAFVHYYAASLTAEIMRAIVSQIVDSDAAITATTQKENNTMRIAIPLANGKLSMHFGHCERFAMIDADDSRKAILNREDIDAPPHEPGLLPSWLAERGATVIIAGGMGSRAQGLFTQHGIQVVVGAPPEKPETLVTNYLEGTLIVGKNVCDH